MKIPGLFTGLVLLAGVLSAGDSTWRPLWNGKDFTGWESWLGKPHASTVVPGESKDNKGVYTEPLGTGRDPLGVFTVASTDGRPAICISGQVFGSLTTKEEFSNYHVRLQFKWGTKKWPPRTEAVRDSGLLYHVHSAPNYNNRTWPRSSEFQIQEHDVGDLYAIGMRITVRANKPAETPKPLYIYDPKGKPVVFLEQKPMGNRCVKSPDNEKPSGEWNTLDLICLGDERTHVVNGKVVMRLTKAQRLDGEQIAPLMAGRILLQSEGAEVYYRDIEIRPITAMPPEFSER